MSYSAVSDIRDSGLETGSRLQIIEAFAHYTRESTGLCESSATTLIYLARCSDRQLTRVKPGLVEDGILNVIQEPGGRGTSGIYQLNLARFSYVAALAKEARTLAFGRFSRLAVESKLIGSVATCENAIAMADLAAKVAHDMAVKKRTKCPPFAAAHLLKNPDEKSAIMSIKGDISSENEDRESENADEESENGDTVSDAYIRHNTLKELSINFSRIRNRASDCLGDKWTGKWLATVRYCDERNTLFLPSDFIRERVERELRPYLNDLTLQNQSTPIRFAVSDELANGVRDDADQSIHSEVRQ